VAATQSWQYYFFAGDIRRGRKCGFEEEKVKSKK
jgi:hypothetical protein